MLKSTKFCRITLKSTFLCFWGPLAAAGWKHQYFLRIIDGLEGS